MKRLLISFFLITHCTLQATLHIQTNSFKEYKNELYEVRIKIAYFLNQQEIKHKKTPDLLNQVSVTAQELINTINKIEDNDMDGVMYSLNRIMKKNIPFFKQTSTMLAKNIVETIDRCINSIQKVTQKILNLIPKD